MALRLFLLAATWITAQARAEVMEIPVHFVVLTNRPEVIAKATEDAFRKELENLNRNFAGADKSPLARFTYKSLTRYDEIKDSPCAIVQNAVRKLDTAEWALRDIWHCLDTRVIDYSAFNYFLIDSYSRKNGYGETISYGFAGTGTREIQGVFIDHFFLGNESVHMHEFGHAFGLDHNWPKDNVMSGGPYTNGFSNAQVKIIAKQIAEVSRKLVTQPVPDRLHNGTFDTDLGCRMWEPCGLYYPGHNSKYAGLAHKGKMSQKFMNRAAGKYSLTVFVNAWGPGGTIAITVNGVARKVIPLVGDGGIDKPWRQVTIEGITLKAQDLVEFVVTGGEKHVWFDDVVWQKAD